MGDAQPLIPEPLMPDSLLQNGKYRILGIIGKGGMGRVYRAQHVPLGREIVIKELTVRDPSSAGEAIEEFRQEADLLYVNLRHVAFPTVKDYFQEGGRFFLVMDLMEGANMQTLIQRSGSLHADRVFWMADRLLSGLAYIHRYEIVHKDIKPGNILLNLRDHRAYLVDFGIASTKVVNTATSSMTPHFAAPEQFAGEDVTTATDIYQLGATMYYAVTGELPKRADKRKSNNDLKQLASFDIKGAEREGIEEMSGIICKAMCLDPGERWGRHTIDHRTVVLLESEGMIEDLRRIRHELHVAGTLEED